MSPYGHVSTGSMNRILIAAAAAAIALAAFFVSVPTAHALPASTWYVDASAAPDGDGTTLLTATTTIQAAINAASSGDTIVVMPGTYVEQLSITKDSLTIQSVGGASVTTVDLNQPSETTGIALYANYVTFTGFTVTNISTVGSHAQYAIRVRGSHNTISNNIIVGQTSRDWNTNQEDSGVNLDGTTATLTTYNTVENNEIYNFSAMGVQVVGTGGFYNAQYNTVQNNNIHDIDFYAIAVDRSAHNTITQNTVSNIGSWGIILWGDLADGNSITNQTLNGLTNGLVLSSAVNTTIDEATITSNSGIGIKIAKSSWAGGIPSGNIIKNSTIQGNATGVLISGVAGEIGAGNVVSDKNTISGNTTGVSNTAPDQTIDATHNWWGASASSTVNASVSGSVTVAPWYIDAGKTTLSNLTSIASFNFTSPAATGVVDNTGHTVSLTVPHGTPLGALVPTIVHSGAFITPYSGTPQDFSVNPVTYTVTAVDDTTQAYAVTVKTSQTITPAPGTPGSAIYGDSFGVGASSDSGLDVAITTTGGCSGSGTNSATITMTSGTTACVVRYNQAGNASYDPAPEVTETVSAQKANLTISGITASSRVYNGGTNATLDTSSAAVVGAKLADSITGNYASAVGTFADKHVGTGKLVTISGITTDANPANYTLTQPTATADITKYSLIITSQTESKTYDRTTVSTTTPLITTGSMQGTDGVLLSQSFDSKTVGTKSLSPSAIVNDGNAGANYNITLMSAPGYIYAKNLSISATADDKVYDGLTTATSHLSTADVISGDTVTLHSVASNFTDPNVAPGKTVNISGLSISGTDSGNYNLVNTSTTATASITEAPLSITADDVTKTYDATAWTGGTVSFSGFVNGENSSVLGGALVMGGDSQGAVHHGVYTLSPSGYTSTNYAITYHDGTLTIDKADPTIVITPYSVTYDGAPHTAAITTASGVGGADFTNPANFNLTGTTHTNAGTYNGDMWYFTSPSGDFNDASGSVDDHIAKADATIVINGYTGTYDAAAHGASIGTALGVLGENLSGSVGLGSTFTNVPGGTAHWTFTGGTNYNDQSGDASITINPYTLTITPNAQSKTYGDSFTFAGTEFTSGGTLGGDSISTVDMTSGATASGAPVSGSPYTITASNAQGTGLGNYDLHYNTANFTVNPKSITATADEMSKEFADVDPTFTFSATGLVLGQSTSTVFSGALTRAAGETVGDYAIGQGTLAANSNYSLSSFTGSTFHIVDTTGPVITITGSNPVNHVTGGTYVDAGATATDAVDGSVAVNTSGSVPNIGVGTYTITYTATDSHGNTSTSTRTVNNVEDTSSTPGSGGGGGGGGGGAPAGTFGQVNQQGGTQGQVLGAALFNFTAEFGIGASGNTVTELQKILIAEGFLKIDAPTGYFGTLTYAALKAYQTAHGITPATGYVGPKTLAELNKGAIANNDAVVAALKLKLNDLMAQLQKLMGGAAH